MPHDQLYPEQVKNPGGGKNAPTYERSRKVVVGNPRLGPAGHGNPPLRSGNAVPRRPK